jgi:ubiquinone/menaquinone biosynthesis C-methylase UbiE
MDIPEEILAHYAEGREHGRLLGLGRLEFERTKDILGRVLPPAPGVVCDVGGGTGRYAAWLAAQGYTVHLLDPMASHVAQALAHAEESGAALASAVVGDARALPWPDGSADACLLLGPLYHLASRADRLLALREARRVLRPGGVLLAAGVSRFASALDGIRGGELRHAAFLDIVLQDLRTGEHRNDTANPRWFTTAYFHTPEDLCAEVVEAGFAEVTVRAVEGPAWLVGDLGALWADGTVRERVMTVLRLLEEEPSLLGASAHLVAGGVR